LKYAKVLAKTSHLKHSSGRDGKVGENLAMGTKNDYDTERLIYLWTKEKKNYIPGKKFPNVSRTGNWKDVAHYTQIVWRNTSKVGCGVATNTKWKILVCHYTSAGNWIGSYPY